MPTDAVAIENQMKVGCLCESGERLLQYLDIPGLEDQTRRNNRTT